MEAFEPAPPAAMPPLKQRRGLKALATAAIAVPIVALVVAVLIGYGVFDPGPGEPGWTPLVGSNNSHSSSGKAGFQVSQLVENDTKDTLVIEKIRGVGPGSFAEFETGTLSNGLWTEYYVFSPPKLGPFPFTLESHHEVKLIMRFHVSCTPGLPPFKAPLKILATVWNGKVRQEVEVSDVVGINMQSALEPPVPAC